MKVFLVNIKPGLLIQAVVLRQRKEFVRSLKLMKVCLKWDESEGSLAYNSLEKYRVSKLHQLWLLSIPCPYMSDRVVAIVSGELY